MNLFTRRCGCGAVFALVHLRDRSQQCSACQRKAAARLSRQASLADIERAAKTLEAAERDRQQKAAQEFMRWAMKKLEERRERGMLPRSIEESPCP